MIIIKTNNGDRFINDSETLLVSHIKDKAQVEVCVPVRSEKQTQPRPYVIEHVEAVMYTNNAQPTHWQDEGSEIERLKDQLEDIMQLKDENIKKETENVILQNKVARLQEKLRDFGCEL
jgi:hypothetical protein